MKAAALNFHGLAPLVTTACASRLASSEFSWLIDHSISGLAAEADGL